MRYKLLLMEMMIIIIVSCCEIGTESTDYNWKSLGLEDKVALRLVIAEPYLYVCAGNEGLWRRDLSVGYSVEWEFLGLADTSQDEYSNRGVSDVVVDLNNHNTMLVAFATGNVSNHCVHKSTDGGNTWFPSDSGMASDFMGERIFSQPRRFIKYPSLIIAAGTEIFSSNDFGISWINLGPVWGPVTGVATNALEYHSKNTTNIWLGGESVFFTPILLFSLDTGNSWDYIDLTKIVTLDNAVYSIAFDPVDANIVYVGMSGALIKTEDGGQTWIIIHEGEWYPAMESDPRNRNHLWASAGRSIIQTFDGGKTWKENDSPSKLVVRDMLYDDITKSMYLATDGGIYYLRL